MLNLLLSLNSASTRQELWRCLALRESLPVWWYAVRGAGVVLEEEITRGGGLCEFRVNNIRILVPVVDTDPHLKNN
jgi:hypothetical protein